MKLVNEINVLVEGKFAIKAITDKLQKDTEEKLTKDITDKLINQAKAEIALIKKENITQLTRWNYEHKFDKIEMTYLMDLIGNPDPKTIALKKDHKAIAEKMAKRNASEIVGKFIGKIHTKLTSIVDSVGAPKKWNVDSYVDSGNLAGEMKMGWGKARFDFRVQIVYGETQNGKWFAKYPGTFHNVVNGDGKKIKKVSMAKIEKEFFV